MTDTAHAVAQALLAIDAVGFTPHRPITFKSGILSPVYVDNRRLPFFPVHWKTVIDGFQSLLQAQALPFDVVAGVAVGGVPHSAVLGYALSVPSVFIRKEAKEHGKQRRVEGGDVDQKRVLLIEDLVTSGGSCLNAVEALREEGAIVTDVCAIVSYGFPEATENFYRHEVALHTLTTFSTILAIAGARFSDDERATIQDWFYDPFGWGKRHGHA